MEVRFLGSDLSLLSPTLIFQNGCFKCEFRRFDINTTPTATYSRSNVLSFFLITINEHTRTRTRRATRKYIETRYDQSVARRHHVEEGKKSTCYPTRPARPLSPCSLARFPAALRLFDACAHQNHTCSSNVVWMRQL